MSVLFFPPQAKCNIRLCDVLPAGRRVITLEELFSIVLTPLQEWHHNVLLVLH